MYKNYPVCPDINGSGPSKSIVCPVVVDSQPGGTLPDLESVEAAQNFLDGHIKRDSDEPFFLAAGFHKPHIPLKFPTDYLSKCLSIQNVVCSHSFTILYLQF